MSMVWSLQKRLEHSATWNAQPWPRKASKQFLMKQSSPFSTPRKRRNVAPSVTAAVQFSEVAWDPPPPPRLRVRPSSATKLKPTRRPCQKEAPSPRGSCARWALPHTAHSSAHCHVLHTSQSIYIAHTARTLSPGSSQCLCWACWKQSQRPSCVLLLPVQDREADRKSQQKTERGTQFLYWWPYLMSFTKHRNTTLTFFSESTVLPMCLTVICIILRNLLIYQFTQASQIHTKLA